ncbi:MAG TPA: RNA polymerase sigma factor [Planctomycetota bacterium]|nr:RNA polymerase sigma factor [Planctomycetota bacterium]
MARPSKQEVDRIVLAEYESLIRLVKRKLGLQDLEAVDLVHEAVTRIYGSLENFDAARGVLQAWARGILKNLVLQFREGRRRPLMLDPGVDMIPSDSQPAGDSVGEEVAAFVRGSVERLPTIYREVVRLRYLDGLELKVIGRRLNIPLGTVKARLFRAPRMLQDALSIQETTARFYLDQLGRRTPPP